MVCSEAGSPFAKVTMLDIVVFCFLASEIVVMKVVVEGANNKPEGCKTRKFFLPICYVGWFIIVDGRIHKSEIISTIFACGVENVKSCIATAPYSTGPASYSIGPASWTHTPQLLTPQLHGSEGRHTGALHTRTRVGRPSQQSVAH